MIAIWILLGLGIGWAGGRLLAIRRGGQTADLTAGALGSLGAAGLATMMLAATRAGALEIALIGVVGALSLTFVRRAFSDRFQRVV